MSVPEVLYFWIENHTFRNGSLFCYFADLDYYNCFSWLLTFCFVLYIPQYIFVLWLYLSALIFQYHKYRYKIKTEDYEHADWVEPRKNIARIWKWLAKWLFGYESIGLENIPKSGPAVLVYYHGALPFDYYFLLADVYLKGTDRYIRTNGHRFVHNVPGWRALMQFLLVNSGSVEECAKVLQDGHLLSISPGGIREAQFSDSNYKLWWGEKCGFARVAIQGKAPIIPVFTENVREALRTFPLFKDLLLRIFNKFKIPLVQYYGGFPVKLRTHIGKPIPFDPSISAEELAKKAAASLEDLIRINQRLPGSILAGLLDRFR